MEKAIKNLTAERIVVGTLLNHPEWVLDVATMIKPEFFWSKTHRILYYLLVRLTEEGVENIETMTILAKAETISKATKTIDDSGGYEYLEELRSISTNYTKDDLKHYTKEVVACSYKRDQKTNKEEFLRLIESKSDWSVSDVNMWLQRADQELQAKYSVGSNVRLIGEVFDDIWDQIENQRQSNGVIGLPCKIPLVNRFWSYQPGELIVLGARAKYGKSNFAINEAHHLAVVQGVPVAVLDSEMATRTFLARIIALDSGVPISQIQNGRYKDDTDKLEAVERSKERIKKAPLIHKYNPYWEQSNVALTAKLLKLRHNIQLLIYDYIKVKAVSGSMKEHQELGNWTIFLKDLAGDLDIPVLTFAQLSPHERRLADSDKINRYASVVAYLLPKSPDEITRDMGIELGGADYMYVDYNRLGESMQDPAMGVNMFYTRYLAKFEQATYQPLVEDDD